ncbi:UNVERIFIED_CONTAM: hypothetical protein Slati_4596300 [Sesamum latifolium]|uniref:Uncharacterized protein n=1 Tax=Sesamum latifolium TaxID=2727402 RepID=A0AAW2S2D3_9LAMI
MVTPVSDHDSVLELVGAIKDNLPMLLREVCTLDRSSTQGLLSNQPGKSSSHYAGSTGKYASKAAKRTGKGAMAKACLLPYELASWRPSCLRPCTRGRVVPRRSLGSTSPLCVG